MMETQTTLPPKRTSLRDQPARISMSIDDTAHALGIGRTTVYELIAARKLEAITIGRKRLVLHSSIQRLIADARAGGDAA